MFKTEPKTEREARLDLESSTNKDFAKFNFKQADKEDVMGLMYRNEEEEGRLKADVTRYL